MKATELIVGDYIMFNGSPYIIEEISAKGWIHILHIKNKARVALSSDYILDFIEGIPLTLEILEKNGFICTQCDDEEIGTYESWSFQSDFITITCEPTLCMLDVFNGNLVKEIKFYTEESTLFVHELQHALKLCEISKEIIL